MELTIASYSCMGPKHHSTDDTEYSDQVKIQFIKDALNDEPFPGIIICLKRSLFPIAIYLHNQFTLRIATPLILLLVIHYRISK